MSSASILRPSLDYTSKDFDALRARLFNLIDSAFPTWTDRQIADFGNILIELFAFTGDVLTFYLDNQALESRWSSARLRRSMISLAKLIDYAPKGASAATTALTVQLAQPPMGAVVINVGDTFRTLEIANTLTFQAITSAVIGAGADPPVATVVVEHSSNSDEQVISTDLPDQEYVLGDAPYLDGSIIIVAGDGVYTQTRDFLDSTATDRHFSVSVDENDKAHVRFGDGIAGAIPKGTIAFTYKTGGGSAGIVEPNAIRRANKAYVDAYGNAVQVSVSNPNRASGGAERQTVESIRESAPRSVRTVTRTVCREDFEAQAYRVKGVARALMMGKDERPAILENTGELYVVPAGGGVPSEALLDEVRTMCTITYPKTITFKVIVRPAVYLQVDVSARVHLAKGATPAVVGPAIRQALATFFAPTNANGTRNLNIDFGYYLDESLAFSDLYNVVRDTVGVRKIDDGLSALTINGQTRDLEVPLQMFPTLGTVTLIDVGTGLPLP